MTLCATIGGFADSGSPEFAEQVIRVGRSPSPIAIADVNHDGKLDIIVGNMDDGTVSVLLGDGHGHFMPAHGSPFPCNANPNDIAVADVNGDGIPDVAVIPYEPQMRDPKQLGLTVLLGNGKGGMTAMRGSPFSLAGCRGPNRVAIGDVRGDGLRDIVVSCAENNELVFFMGTRNGAFNVFTRSIPAGWGGVALADLTGNGKDDVVVSNDKAGTITILFSK
ncbi:MAG: VCBS repeat-containing protein [Candidatus Acidiferrales bacterium]